MQIRIRLAHSIYWPVDEMRAEIRTSQLQQVFALKTQLKKPQQPFTVLRDCEDTNWTTWVAGDWTHLSASVSSNYSSGLAAAFTATCNINSEDCCSASTWHVKVSVNWSMPCWDTKTHPFNRERERESVCERETTKSTLRAHTHTH